MPKCLNDSSRNYNGNEPSLKEMDIVHMENLLELLD